MTWVGVAIMSGTLYLANHDGGMFRHWIQHNLPAGAGIVLLTIMVTLSVSLMFIFWGKKTGQLSDVAAERMFEKVDDKGDDG